MWEDLWNIVNDTPNEPATISMSPIDMFSVTIQYNDGSSAGLYWSSRRQKWQFAEILDKQPCDVATRDSF